MKYTQKNIAFRDLKKFQEFRKLKLKYQYKMSEPILTDCDYVLQCANLVNKSIEVNHASKN